MGQSVDVEVSRNHVYHSTATESLALDLYYPKTDAVAPVLVYAHGGAFFEKDKGGPDSEILPEIASRGVACVDIQYRLAPTVTFPAPIQDMNAAIRWTRTNAAQYGFDTDRIWAGGVSAGAYLGTFCACTSNQPKYLPDDGRDCVSTRLAGAIGISGIYDLPRYCEFNDIPTIGDLKHGKTQNTPNSDIFETVIGESFKQNPARYRELSPTRQATADTPSILLCHGTADSMLPYEQAEYFREILANLDVRVEFFTADGGGHGFFRDPEWRSKIISKINDFISNSR